MKSSNKTFTRMLLAGASLIVTSAVIANEAAIEPEIAICNLHLDVEPIVLEAVTKNLSVDEEIDSTDDVTLEVEPEITIDDVVDEVSDEDTGVDTDVVVTWLPEWTYRNTGEGEIPMTTSGNTGDGGTVFTMEELASQSGAPVGNPTSVAPQAADEVSAVTATISKNTVSAKIQGVASKPTVVKSNGRVFLR